MAVITAQPYDYSLPTQSGLALLIIDMQRDFLEPGGFGSVLGNDVTPLAAIVPTVVRLQHAFRQRGLPIFQTVEGHRPDLADCPPASTSGAIPPSKLATLAPWGGF